jgi:cyclophilin family peptidyl-prolyl cis-trans isomerase
MKPFLFTILCWSLLLGHSLFANSVVRFSSNVGEIDMELFDTEKPLTVANFLSYVESGRYDGSFIHRSVPEFVIQGGGFGLSGNAVVSVPTNAAVPNEPGISNQRGTVAMAKLGDNPNSATSQWFINLEDNAENLDAQNGGFTVFGHVVGNGMAVADRIAAFATYNATAQLGGAFGNLPLQSAAPTTNNLILFSTVRPLPAESIVREFDFSSGDQGFTSGFADLPASYDAALYNLVADHRNLPAEIGGGKGLFISGSNRSDDLWMFWKKKLLGLQPSTEYQVVLDIEMASNVAPGLVGVGGAPGESVYVKAGASQAEPLVAPDSEGQLRLTVDKGNQSTSGSAAAVLGNVAKENDNSDQYAILHRNNRSIQQSATTSADGSLWIFFGTDSGFESTTALYYTHAAAVLMPKAKPSLPQIGGGAAPAPSGGNPPEKAKKGKGSKKSSASKSASAKSKSTTGSSAKKSGTKKPKKKK